MRNVLKSRLTAGILILIVVCLGIVFAGDVTVQDGDLTATGTGTFDTVKLISGETYPLVLDIDGYDWTAERTLTFRLIGDADRTLYLQGSPTLDNWFDQSVKTTASPTFANPTLTGLTFDWDVQDWNFTNREGGIFAVKGSGVGTAGFELYTGLGQGLENAYYCIVAYGSPDDITNYEIVQLIYNQIGSKAFKVWVRNAGTGTFLRPLILETGNNTNQLKLDTGGEVYMAQAVDDGVSNLRAAYWDSVTGQIGYDSSSREFKTNIVDLPNTTSEKIYQLRPRKYDKIGGAKNQFGLIADEVNKIYPEIVSYKRREIRETVKDDDFGDYERVRYELTDIPETLDYSKLVVPLLQEVRKLKQENQLLKYEIAKLKTVVGIE